MTTAAAAPASLGLPAEAPFRCPKPGTVIRTTVGELRFAGQDGSVCRFRNAGGVEAARFAHFWAADSQWSRERPDSIRRLWPLAAGKRTEFSEPGEGGPVRYSYTVEGVEMHDVPAGRFRTFRVRYQAERLGGSRPEIQTSRNFWYAPDLGYFIRARSETGAPAYDPDWEAIAVTVPG